MAGLFQRLIELGSDDRPDAAATSSLAAAGSPAAQTADDDLAGLPHDRLVSHAKKLQAALSEKVHEFDQLKSESQSLRAEYDGFKRKVDKWQSQMKEVRDTDRRLIEGLRAAGSTGSSTDEVFVKSMHETVAKYKELLRSAQEEATRAQRKQLEAEEARAQAEASKQRDIEALSLKFEGFKARMQAAHVVGDDTRQGHATSGSMSAAADVDVSPPNAASFQSPGGATPSGRERDSLESTSLAVSDFAALRRQLEAAQWDLFEKDKSLAETRSEVATLRSKLDASTSALERAEQHRLADEQAMLKRYHEAKEESSATEQRLRAQLHDVNEQVKLAEQRATDAAAIVGEQEVLRARSAEQLEGHRRTADAQLVATQRRAMESESQRQSLQDMVDEQRVELRSRDESIDQIRGELWAAEQRVMELEGSLLLQHRAISARDDDAFSIERERQRYRADVESVRDTADAAKRQLQDAQHQLQDCQAALRSMEARCRELLADRDRLQAEVRGLRSELQLAITTTTSKDQLASDLASKLSEQSQKTADAVRSREDQSARLRLMEGRLQDLDRQLKHAATVGSTAVPLAPISHTANASSFQFHYRAATSSASDLVSIAYGYARALLRTFSWQQWKTLIVVVVTFVLAISLLNGVVAASGQAAAATTSQRDAVLAGQSVNSLEHTQQQLRQCEAALAVALRHPVPSSPPTGGLLLNGASARPV